MNPALVIVDMQNWFFRAPSRKKVIPSIIKKINELIDFFQKNNYLVINVITVFNDKKQWDILMKKYNKNVLRFGTESAKKLKDLRNITHKIVKKTRHSAFIRTNFEKYLRKNRIDTLILAGVFIDGCIGLTAVDGYERDFNIILAKEAIYGTRASESKFMLDFLKKEFEIKALPNSAIIKETIKNK